MLVVKTKLLLASPTSSNKTYISNSEIAYSDELEGIGKYAVTRPIIDRLSFTLPFHDADGQKAIKELLLGLIDGTDGEEQLYTSAKKAAFGQQRYKVNVSLRHPESQRAILIQADPKAKKDAYLRFEMNPDRLGKAGVLFFRNHLSDFMLGAITWADITSKARVTRIDLACDLLNVSMGQLAYAAKSEGKSHLYFGVGGETETAYLAVKKGKSSKTTVYNKRQQLTDKARAQKYGGIPQTRIEFRVTTARPLADLDGLLNPFKNIEVNFLAPTATGLADHCWQHFCDSVRQRGLNAALALVPEEARAAYVDGLSSGHPLWRPQDIWATWKPALLRSGLT